MILVLQCGVLAVAKHGR